MGAKTVMTMALRNPDCCANIIPVDNAPVDAALSSDFPKYAEGMQRVEQAKPMSQKEADEVLQPYAKDLPVRQFLLTNLIRPVPSEQLQWRIPVKILTDALDNMADFPFTDPDVTRFNKKTLFVRGTRSHYVSDETLPIVGRFFPRFEVVDIDSGHWVISEKPDEFIKGMFDCAGVGTWVLTRCSCCRVFAGKGRVVDGLSDAVVLPVFLPLMSLGNTRFAPVSGYVGLSLTSLPRLVLFRLSLPFATLPTYLPPHNSSHIVLASRRTHQSPVTFRPESLLRHSLYIMKVFSYVLMVACVALALGEVINEPPTQSKGRLQNSTASALVSEPAGFDTPPALGFFDPNNVADDALWDRYVAKGYSLMCALRGSDQFAGEYLNDQRSPPSAASIWRGDFAQDMAKFGWVEMPGSYIQGEYFNDGGSYNLENAFRGLGISPYADDPEAEVRGHNKIHWPSHGDYDKRDENDESIKPADQYYNVDGTQYRVRPLTQSTT